MKNIFIWMVLSVCAIGAMAQNVPNDSVRMRIKQIKLSEQYFYAEAAAEALDEAREVAVEELYIRIVEYLSTEGKSKDEMVAVRGKMEQQYQALEYQNGSLHKSFVYIDKRSLSGGEAPPELPADEPQLVVVVDTVPIGSGMPAEDSFIQEEKNVDSPDMAEGKPVVTEKPIIPEKPVAPEKPVVAGKPVVRDSVASETPVVSEEDVAETLFPLETLPETHRRVVTDILALDTFEGVMLYLGGMKEDGRLMYGRINTLVSPEKAYLIVVKDGKLLTVLGRGTGERMNLRTGHADAIRNYKGHAVIWLKIFD